MLVKELLMLCLIATLAALIALAREDAFFTTVFATASGFILSFAVRQTGDK
jgi:hypothetical protein